MMNLWRSRRRRLSDEHKKARARRAFGIGMDLLGWHVFCLCIHPAFSYQPLADLIGFFLRVVIAAMDWHVRAGYDRKAKLSGDAKAPIQLSLVGSWQYGDPAVRGFTSLRHGCRIAYGLVRLAAWVFGGEIADGVNSGS